MIFNRVSAIPLPPSGGRGQGIGAVPGWGKGPGDRGWKLCGADRNIRSYPNISKSYLSVRILMIMTQN